MQELKTVSATNPKDFDLKVNEFLQQGYRIHTLKTEISSVVVIYNAFLIKERP